VKPPFVVNSDELYLNHGFTYPFNFWLLLMPQSVKTADEVRDMLDFVSAKLDCCLVIDGESLQVRCFRVHDQA